MNQKYKNVVINALLAFVVSFATVVAATDKPFDKAVLIAAAVAGVRAAAGFVAAALGKPIGTDATHAE